jgi:hypothetical protein
MLFSDREQIMIGHWFSPLNSRGERTRAFADLEASSTRPLGIRTPGFAHSAWDVTIDAVARRPNERIDPAVQGTT